MEGAKKAGRNLRRELAGPQKRLVFSGGCRDCPALLRFRLARSCRAGIAARRSVSYTHLDVYKRQHVVFRPDALGVDVVPDVCHFRFSPSGAPDTRLLFRFLSVYSPSRDGASIVCKPERIRLVPRKRRARRRIPRARNADGRELYFAAAV